MHEGPKKDHTILIRVYPDGSFEMEPSGCTIDLQGILVKTTEPRAEEWRRKTALALFYLKLDEEMAQTLKEIKFQRSERRLSRDKNLSAENVCINNKE